MPESWEYERYSANVCYQNAGANGANTENRKNECLWYSPHCAKNEQGVLDFEAEAKA